MDNLFTCVWVWVPSGDWLKSVCVCSETWEGWEHAWLKEEKNKQKENKNKADRNVSSTRSPISPTRREVELTHHRTQTSPHRPHLQASSFSYYNFIFSSWLCTLRFACALLFCFSDSFFCRAVIWSVGLSTFLSFRTNCMLYYPVTNTTRLFCRTCQK